MNKTVTEKVLEIAGKNIITIGTYVSSVEPDADLETNINCP